MSRVLFAAEFLLPAHGGAERYALDLLEALAGAGHEVRALWLSDGDRGGDAIDRLPAGVEGRACRAPLAGGYWANKTVRRKALGEAVAAQVPDARPDVLVTQLHAAPGAMEAAPDVPAVLLLPSYESLCKYAFDAGSTCGPYLDCVRCPRARSLPDAEGAKLRVARTAHGRTLADAAELVAPSDAVATATENWCGRRPEVVPAIAAAPQPARAHVGGHVVIPAVTWSPNHGVDLLVPLVAELRHRDIVITPHGLADDVRGVLAASGNVWFMEGTTERLLAGAAVCLVPSRWPEPFARVAFEAQVAGVPVIASAVGGLPEVVPQRGLLPPEAAAEDWAAAVRTLEDPEEWRDAHGRAHAAANALLAQRPLERVIEIVERAAAR